MNKRFEQLLGYEHFSKRSKTHLPQTEHPNALPASWRCPSKHKNVVYAFVSSQHVRIVFGHGCDYSSYVEILLEN